MPFSQKPLLGADTNALACYGRNSGWREAYRVAGDGKAYTYEEFKEFYTKLEETYGWEPSDDKYWNEARGLCPDELHAILLIHLRRSCDRIRGRKVLESLRTSLRSDVLHCIATFLVAKNDIQMVVPRAEDDAVLLIHPCSLL